MSWTWRKHRVPVQAALGWRAPHELVDDYAARGVRIAELAGRLSAAENLLALSDARFAESKTTVKQQAALIVDLTGRIERQADNHEADRAEWERVKSRMAARIAELGQTVVAMSAASGLDAAWPDVAAVVAAQAVYSNAYNGVYIREGGPEHLRKAVAEDRCSVERAALAEAEVDELAAEEGRRLAELGWRSAMAGAAAPEAGE